MGAISKSPATKNKMAKNSKLGTWLKMLGVGGAVCVGGPALVFWISPTDEELFKRYNPELQKRSLARRHERQQEFDDYVMQLREFSKSDKPIWVVQEEAARKFKQDRIQDDIKQAEAARARKEELRREAGLASMSKS